MDLNKLPRTTLLLIAALGILAIGLVATDAKAKVEKAVANSTESIVLSQQNQLNITDLKDSVKEIRLAQEVFRREYREDRKEDASLLRAMKDEIIKAVKS